MRQYLELVEHVLTHGKLKKKDNQGIGSIASFVYTMRFRPAEEFPLITTKKVSFRWILGELLWYLRGDSRIDYLVERGIHSWDPWATKEVTERYGLAEGDVGPIYPVQWIHWKKRGGGEINQIAELVNELRAFPESRRLMVTSWNPEDLNVPVAPCHGILKCFVADGELSLINIQRSGDIPVGIPFNMGAYSILLLMLAQVADLRPGEFIHTILDAHIYLNQVELAKEQLKRVPKPPPKVSLDPNVKDIFKFDFKHFTLEGYDPYPPIRYPVGV